MDPGAFTNLGGKARSCLQGKITLHHGLKPEQAKMKEPLSVAGIAGVGDGTQSCECKGKFPIAIPASEGTKTHAFEAPTCSNR